MITYPKLTLLLIALVSLPNATGDVNLFSECVSPQTGIIGHPYVIKCTPNTKYEGIYWFEESDETEPVIRYEDEKTIGRGYENDEYNIESDGSLKIKKVSQKHQMVYKVVVIDMEYNIDDRLITFFAHEEIIEEIPYDDPSHQYGLLGKRASIKFSAPPGFQGVYWYNQWDEQDPFIRYEDETKLGRGYDNGEYDILPNGSLIINKVTLSHDMIFSVVLIDEHFGTTEQQITFTPVEQSTPLITKCFPGTYCHAYVEDVDNVRCIVVRARPEPKVEWLKMRSHLNGTIVPFSSYKGVHEDQDPHLFNSSAVLPTETLSNIAPTVFQCKATGPAIKSNSSHASILIESKDFYEGLSNSSDIETVVNVTSSSLACDVAGERSLVVWRSGASVAELETIIYAVKGSEEEYEDSEIGISKDGHLILKNKHQYLNKVFACVVVHGNGSESVKMYRIIAIDNSDMITPSQMTSSDLPAEPSERITKYTSIGLPHTLTGLLERTSDETTKEITEVTEKMSRQETITVKLTECQELSPSFTTEIMSEKPSEKTFTFIIVIIGSFVVFLIALLAIFFMRKNFFNGEKPHEEGSIAEGVPLNKRSNGAS